MRASSKRFELLKVDNYMLVVLGVIVCGERSEITASALRFEKCLCRIIAKLSLK